MLTESCCNIYVWFTTGWCIFLTHIAPAMILYFWIPLLLLCILPKSVEYMFGLDILNDPNKTAKELGKDAALKLHLSLHCPIIMFVVILCVECISQLYMGKFAWSKAGYFDAFWWVFWEERKVVPYLTKEITRTRENLVYFLSYVS